MKKAAAQSFPQLSAVAGKSAIARKREGINVENKS
jgi:hypothetical protein